MTRRLRGITWDHPRGYRPLSANAARFTAEHPDIEVVWSRRSLRDFGVQPVEMLAERYDLIVIDHPFCGRARVTGCLRDLRPLFPADFFAMLDAESVGPTTRSYDCRGGIWALPTDAAAQVASYRPDLLTALGATPPRTAGEVLALGRRARKAGKHLALPSVASDSACLVATLSANLGRPIREADDRMLPGDVFEAVLDYLQELIALSHPDSPRMNPIAVYDAMSSADDIVYVPFGFGYVNYSCLGAAKPIRFADMAGPGADPAAGAILGGAGCAISASCADVDAAVVYLAWVHRASIRPATTSARAASRASAPPGPTRRSTAPPADSFRARSRRSKRATSAPASTASSRPSSTWGSWCTPGSPAKATAPA